VFVVVHVNVNNNVNALYNYLPLADFAHMPHKNRKPKPKPKLSSSL